MATVDAVCRVRQAARQSSTSVVTRSRPRWYVEVAIVAFFYAAYERSRAAAPTHPGRALRHAYAVISAERTLHLGVEASVNQVFAAHAWLASLGGYYYATLNFVVTPAVLVWLYTRRPDLFARARTMLVLASFGALAVYVLYPVSPPRLAIPGMTDILVIHNIFGAAHAAKSGGFINIYAAMPSLHVGWAVWSALWVSRSYPTSRWRHAAWLYPVATTLVVLGTANHYVLDAIGGLTIMLIAERLTAPSTRALLRACVHRAIRPLGRHSPHSALAHLPVAPLLTHPHSAQRLVATTDPLADPSRFTVRHSVERNTGDAVSGRSASPVRHDRPSRRAS